MLRTANAGQNMFFQFFQCKKVGKNYQKIESRGLPYVLVIAVIRPRQVLEPKAPPTRNGPNTGSLAPGVRRRVKKKKTLSGV